MMRNVIYLVAAISVLILSGCTTIAPVYQADVENVKLLKKSANAIKTDSFSVAKGQNAISLRGTRMLSPVNDSYADYLENALRSELQKANLFNELSPLVISANIIENDLNASGVSRGEGTITVEFKINRDSEVVFSKQVNASITWESSFIGAVAIPNAQYSYPKLVKNLLANLYHDTEFKQVMGATDS